MANYEDENHQFSTILTIADSGVWLENDLWGRFFTKRFDGSIYWDGWRTKHKPGDVIPVLRQKRGNTYAYMTGFDLHTAEEKLRDFIDQKEQDAVVTSVIHIQASAYTQIQAYSPVWKNIYYESCNGMIGVQRGDIATFSRAWATASTSTSTPTTCASGNRCAIMRAISPVPVPISSTIRPPRAHAPSRVPSVPTFMAQRS